MWHDRGQEMWGAQETHPIIERRLRRCEVHWGGLSSVLGSWTPGCSCTGWGEGVKREAVIDGGEQTVSSVM